MKGQISKNKFDPSWFLDINELPEIFGCSDMIEHNNFYIVDKSGEYDMGRITADYEKEARAVREAFLEGCSIRVTGMETWNMNIATQANGYGCGTDVHMYLTPNNPDATAFSEHVDDTDVNIVMLFGSKILTVEGEDFILEPGDELYIPQGAKHFATPIGFSCHLSFGTPEDLTYHVPGGIELSDLIPVQQMLKTIAGIV